MAFFDNPEKKAAWERELDELTRQRDGKQSAEPAAPQTEGARPLREPITLEQLMAEAGAARSPNAAAVPDQPTVQRERTL